MTGDAGGWKPPRRWEPPGEPDRTSSDPPLLPVREHVRREIRVVWRDGYACGYRRGAIVSFVGFIIGTTVFHALVAVLL